ncbi:hypothetical protein [Parasitella parasitica]|uniref:FYR N-terminal domain-containing protein n=1 Tax=Parasitella parasitica TaxID=35722 RepID=A0A0B7NC55_9FUNG|nr:hypothetical protein [Parasitella parasitica]
MDNHSTPQHSLAELAKKPLNGLKEQQQQTKRAFHNSDATAEGLESNIEKLLERNADLTKQLESSLLKISRLRKQRSVLLDVIVKANKNDYADDDDDDSDLSPGDIDSDIVTSDEDAHIATIATSKKRHLKEEDSTEHAPAVKRKKTLGGAGAGSSSQDKTGQPKPQKSKKPIDVKKDEHGNYILPVQLGRVKLLSLGEIIPEPSFYSQTHIFPVGYAIQRTFRSMVQEDLFTMYTCTIERDEENDKPVFCIQGEDSPEIEIRKLTPTDAWAEVLRRSNILRKKVYKNSVSGTEYYGLSSATIRKMVQELPRARECEGYQWTDF